MAKDAADISPKLVPSDELLPRDNSGGIDGKKFARTAQFGDGGDVQGPKSSLSATGGKKSD